MPVALAFPVLAGLALALDLGWIGPQVALGGGVAAAFLLVAGLWGGRGLGGHDESAAEDEETRR